ncbi:hypothetical protein BCON_0064g00390 [Botryotinia convoluta]|uniref:Uncharacterized protein n=1 Tax=Botryotinia convoluta TaxID=54673 RepID=A0A4Z1I7I7_9HELO|nr:hypothetical protein BCON_0064g00390 [Botryotinia convoluta]
MAEALGIAGSAVGIISLAVQLGDGILKLKSFWSAVKDAPEEILYILDELDITHVLLTEIEDSLGSQTISPAAARSLRLCQKGVDILNNAVKELEDEMQQRKKWGRVKVVMKKELLEKMEKRLGRANSLMLMAHQNYIASLSKSRHDEQVRLATQQFSEMVEIRNTLHSFNSAASIITTQQQISSNTTSLSITSSANTASGFRSTRTLSKHQKILNAKLRLPFFSGVWELCAYQQSTSRWAFTLRTYSIVDYSAPIMELARDGDVAGMQQLFQTRQASPFDVDKHGETLLHVGATFGKQNVCQFLMDQGLDTNIEDCLGFPAWSASFSLFDDNTDDFATIQYLVSRSDFDVIHDLWILLDRALYITPESFKWLLQSTEDPIHEKSHRERALLVLAIFKRMKMGMQDLIWLMFDDIDMETCVQNLKQAEFFTLLERIIYCLGFLMADDRIIGGRSRLMASYDECSEDHVNLIHDIFLFGSKYHNLKDAYKGCHYSFFCQLLRGALEPIYHVTRGGKNVGIDRLEQYFQNSIETWLDQIISVGIDLIEYGQWEKRMQDGNRLYDFISFRRSRYPYTIYHYVVSLLSFTYGPKRSDWQFWFNIEPSFMCSGYLEEFWDMVENPERQMPGAWNFDA